MQVPVGIYGEAICYYRNKGEVENIAMFICIYMVGENNAVSTLAVSQFICKFCDCLCLVPHEEGLLRSTVAFLDSS